MTKSQTHANSHPQPSNANSHSGSGSNRQFFTLPFEEIAQITKQNCDAWMNSLQILTTGMNQISQATMQFGQSMMQTKLAAFQAVTRARNLQDAAKAHHDYTKTSMEALIENGEHIAEMVREVATNTAQPINQRTNETIAQFRQKTAA